MTVLRLIRKIALGLIAIVLAYLLVAIGSRLWPLPAADRAAIALMDRDPPPVAGRDGSDAGWLQDHDVPAADRAGAAKALRAYYRAHADDADPVWDGDAVLKRFPKFEGSAPLEGLCGPESDCLADVRAHREKADAILVSQGRRVVAGMDMAGFDGLRYGLGPSPNNPIMPFAHNAQVVRLFHAREFIAGRRQEALDGACRDLAGWRRISGNADTLILSMIALAMVRHDAVLLSGMLAEVPANEPLPASCAAALGPTTDRELDSCMMMQAEYRFATHMLGESLPDTPWYAKLGLRTVDRRRADARLARMFGVACRADALADTRADRSVLPRVQAASKPCQHPRWAVDPVGCFIYEFSPADQYAKYLDRRADVAAIVAGVRTTDWLRGQDALPQDVGRLLASRPEALGLKREPRLSPDGRTMTLALLNPWYADEVELKIPATVKAP